MAIQNVYPFWWFDAGVVQYLLLESMMKEHVPQNDEKCEHGRGDEKYPWFGHVFSGFISLRCVRELKLLSSIFSLTKILMVVVFEFIYRRQPSFVWWISERPISPA